MARREFFREAHKVRIAVLVTLGCSMAEIMEDLETEDRDQILHVLREHGLEISAAGGGRKTLFVRVGPKGVAAIMAAAGQRDLVGADRGRVILQRIAERVGDDPSLIDAILDDQVRKAGS